LASNPFSTRFVRPGVLPFSFPAGLTAAGLVDRLRRSGWRGQIVGPHGSGKSTLLRTLLPELRAAGRTIRLFEVHAGFGWRSANRVPDNDGDQQTLVVVDGYEQLTWWTRHRLRRRCRRQRAGLLVTAHRCCRLPDLWSTTVTLELAQMLTRRLLESGDSLVIRADDVATAFQSCRGNLRETWFRLYDVYENRMGVE
jgi:energy-coupling factor transporter ATP-binding protein EcfA2